MLFFSEKDRISWSLSNDRKSIVPLHFTGKSGSQEERNDRLEVTQQLRTRIRIHPCLHSVVGA